MKYALAIDIGASSGRHILGRMVAGEWETEEVYRFPNGVTQKDGHLVWDMEALLTHVREGIDRALTAHPGEIGTLSVDTWGVDYVLLKGDEPVYPVYAYRDGRTQGVIDAVHARIPFEELYRRTGCQFQPFNSLYQLYADREAGRLQGVTDALMIPEYLLYRLCGTKAREFTNATTTGLIHAETGVFDREILERLELPEHLFPQLSAPGTEIGEYRGIRVLLCATHDTASAVEGIPMEGNAPYISSGTWSLLGVKTEKPITTEESRQGNWSNEGGVGYHRYQKNIMGMWLVNRLREELCPGADFAGIVAGAETSAYAGTVDADDPCFLAPESMRAAFDAALTAAGCDLPRESGDYFRCAYRSLAASYRRAIDELERNTGRKYDILYIVGGGAKNRFLNRLTREETGKEIVALPIEATALGNLKIQLGERGLL
ncbi:MAG: rhamnulokinase [Lachnospiraceae bacterium]|nr:rhamnulokinase [Lachnospiraceae bacterium]